MDSLTDRPEVKSRPVNTFTVPPALVEATGVSKVVMQTLTADEEMLCYKRGAGNSAKLAMELAKTSLVGVDSQRLSIADGSADVWWKEVDPRLRQLILGAYTKIHAATDEDVTSFLESQTLSVG